MEVVVVFDEVVDFVVLGVLFWFDSIVDIVGGDIIVKFFDKVKFGGMFGLVVGELVEVWVCGFVV